MARDAFDISPGVDGPIGPVGILTDIIPGHHHDIYFTSNHIMARDAFDISPGM